MINIEILTELYESQYNEINSIWNLTGVGNPARGDTYDAVCHTLQNGGRIILAQLDDITVGAVWLTHDFRRLYIHHMAVLPEHQHQGIGKLMLTEALNVAKELKYQVKLEVNEDNIIAYNLYQSFGFEPLEAYHTLIKRDV